MSRSQDKLNPEAQALQEHHRDGPSVPAVITAARPVSGPLTALRVVELAGQGPGPFGGMVLADLGCDVVVVERPSTAATTDQNRSPLNPLNRGKRRVSVDLKDAAGIEQVLGLVDRADVLIDPLRPGVCERLGIGPDACCTRNERLIYARMTGWGQHGPLATTAGHDIDYLALSGVLFHLGRAGQLPTPPINLLADFAGGGLLLALGVAAAAFERDRSGRGQVIDAAMIDGAALLFAPFFAAVAAGLWGPRGTNHIDTGAYFYDVYETADARYVAVGAIEPQFHAELLHGLGLPDDGAQWDRDEWPERKQRLAALFRSRTRDEWCALLEGTDACLAPVLSAEEAPSHPHHAARGSFTSLEGIVQPQAAPRFSRTPAVARPPFTPGEDDLRQLLADWS